MFFHPGHGLWFAVPAPLAPERFGTGRATDVAPSPPGGRPGWGPAAQKTATPPVHAASSQHTTAPALP